MIRKPLNRPTPALRLLCFPHAGGSAQAYMGWSAALPPGVELCVAQLPGRCQRFSEPPIERIEPLLDALEASLIPLLDVPFCFFGHSMGALLAFELARRLRRRSGPRPAHLFVSGRRAPRIPEEEEPPSSGLGDAEFIELIRQTGGTPEIVLRTPELMHLMLPVFRADFGVAESWRYEPDEPLDVPITAFGGLEDPSTPRASLEAWTVETRREFSVQIFPGGHFFIDSARDVLLARISATLTGTTPHCGLALRNESGVGGPVREWA